MRNSKNLIFFSGIALFSSSILLLEIVLTRLLSVMIWYHFAFLVISLAMFGLASGGLFVMLKGKGLSEDQLIKRSRYFSLYLLLFFFISTRFPQSPFDITKNPIWLFLFLLNIFLLTIPFYHGGIILAYAITFFRQKIAPLYFATMFGSALGSIAAIFAFSTPFGGSGAILLVIIIAILSGFLLHPYNKKENIRSFVLLSISIFLLLFSPHLFPIPSPLQKYVINVPEKDKLGRRWNSFSCVDFFKNPQHWGIWGISKNFQGEFPDQIGITIDGWALTSIVKFDGDFSKLKFFDYLPANLPFWVIPAKNALIIGAGGGIDVLAAYYYGIEDIDAVEINPLIVNGVLGDFAHFAGNLYSLPGIKPLIAEGRHYLERTDKKYDIIMLSGVDTLAATQAGAYSLSENYLYTIEAFKTYFRRLNPCGVVSLTRWYFRPPRQTLRIMVLADYALRGLGNSTPENCIAIVNSDRFSVSLIKPDGFSNEEVGSIKQICLSKGFNPLYYPGIEKDNPFTQYILSKDRQQFIKNYLYNIQPPTDDKPFFMEHHRLSKIFKSIGKDEQPLTGQVILLFTFSIVLFFTLIFLIFPLIKRVERISFSFPYLSILCYFACIGIGFILIENALIQRFLLLLGHPNFSITTIFPVLLFSTGTGSLLSSFVHRKSQYQFIALSLIIFALALTHAFFMPSLIGKLLSKPFYIRVFLSVISIFPAGLFMGFFFPLGISLIKDKDHKLIPWVWAINGVFSVSGSALSVLIGMTFGFSGVFLLAGLFYLLAGIFIRGYIQ